MYIFVIRFSFIRVIQTFSSTFFKIRRYRKKKLKIEYTNVQSIMRHYMERIILTMSIEYVQNVTIDLLEMNQHFQTLEIGSLLQIYVRKTKYF